MLQLTLTILITSLWSFSHTGQDTTIYQVEYICETKIQKGRVQDGLNTLYFSGNKSLYIHNDFPTESRWAGDINDPNMRSFHYIQGDSEGLPVYINLTLDSMIYKSEYGDPNINFIWTKPIPKIDWDILDLERNIGDFTARLAVGDFGGRTYEAWFTEEIPVPFGPYKLNGLPGLILEAFSRDEFVRYRFKSFKKSDDTKVEIAPPKDGNHINMDDFVNRRLQSLYRVEAGYGATQRDPPPNWEIEKNKWTIYSDYRKERAEKRRQKR